MTSNRSLLEGQKALVTGGSSGIGEAIVRSMAEAGAAVGVNYLSGGDSARRLVDEIGKAGGQAVAVKADVSKENEVQKMFAEVLEAFGSIDILVSNAGIQRDASVMDMTLREWDEVLSVNLTGAFLCTRAAVREFVRRGVEPRVSNAAGKILFIGSVHEVIPWAGHVNYAASKGGLAQLMKSVAQEVAKHKIRVNAIAPGAIKTSINRASWQTEEAAARLLELIPYGRIGEPEDVGKAAVWLASDEADYVHGETLFVDGGMTLYPCFAEGG